MSPASSSPRRRPKTVFRLDNYTGGVELTADQKGNIAEAAITFAALKLGVDVYHRSVKAGATT